jgi:hypothetical protein
VPDEAWEEAASRHFVELQSASLVVEIAADDAFNRDWCDRADHR